MEGCIAATRSLCIFIAHAPPSSSSVGFLVRVLGLGITKFNQGLIYVLVADGHSSMLHSLIKCKTRRGGFACCLKSVFEEPVLGSSPVFPASIPP